jgi:hypothetical protein
MSTQRERAESSVQHARRLIGITDVFLRAVDDFNNRDWVDFATLLDPNVKAFTVHGMRPVTGRDNVVQYLKDDVANQNPFFILIGPPQASGSTVHGFACWTDNPAVEVSYRFHFSQNLTITKMSAPEDGTLCVP